MMALYQVSLSKMKKAKLTSLNEKGRVEDTVGYVRRNALVLLPEVQSIEELNHYLLDWCLKEAQQRTVPHTNEKVISTI